MCVGGIAKKRLMRQLKHAVHADIDVPILRQLADANFDFGLHPPETGISLRCAHVAIRATHVIPA